jgi:hypothetical protein
LASKIRCQEILFEHETKIILKSEKVKKKSQVSSLKNQQKIPLMPKINISFFSENINGLKCIERVNIANAEGANIYKNSKTILTITHK